MGEAELELGEAGEHVALDCQLRLQQEIEDRLHELEQLYRSIALLGELTVRGRDRITSLGEQLSANILAAVLRERGLRAQAISAAELIITDNQFGAARPIMKQTCHSPQLLVSFKTAGKLPHTGFCRKHMLIKIAG